MNGFTTKSKHPIDFYSLSQRSQIVEFEEVGKFGLERRYHYDPKPD